MLDTPTVRGGIKSIDGFLIGGTTLFLATMMRTKQPISHPKATALQAACPGPLTWPTRGPRTLP